MANPRRFGPRDSQTSVKIIEITEEMIRTGGYASVTTRKVAAKAGLNPTSVHYYFKTTDDLMVAVYRTWRRKTFRDMRKQCRKRIFRWRYGESIATDSIMISLTNFLRWLRTEVF